MPSTQIDFDWIAEAITPDQLAQALGAEKLNGSYRCPMRERHSNEDKNPSFSIYRDSGRTLAKCHGCQFSGSVVQIYAGVHGCSLEEAGRELARLCTTPLSQLPPRATTLVTYDYTDANGQLLFQVVEAPIYVVEGEKDAEAMKALGVLATTNPGGAGKWLPVYSEAFRGTSVVVIPDKDAAGRKHALSIYRSLTGIAHSVEIKEAKAGKDASDHIDAGLGL